jgi:demethylmenaquinone methyltransferase/2-methoxy-6-polyprenyl-1,4-benzoquinol methylase
MCDFSTEMRRLADAKLGRKGRGRAWYVCCDVTRTPFRDRVFDGQMQGFAIRNLFDRIAFFSEVSRTNAPSGRGALLDLSTPRSRIWRAICNLHFRLIAPRLVRLVAGRGVFAYRYLSESVEHNATAERVTGEIASAGLPQARYEPLAGGIGALFIWGPEP